SASLFCLVTSPPPVSTLFPYTTLFRSCDLAALLVQVFHRSVLCPLAARFNSLRVHAVLDRFLSSNTSRASSSRTFANAHFLAQSDRKSTRLNSSHVKISYAVFCLKKKK